MKDSNIRSNTLVQITYNWSAPKMKAWWSLAHLFCVISPIDDWLASEVSKCPIGQDLEHCTVS